MVDLLRVHKKVSEARFFLDLLTKQEQRIIGDKEPFDYFLSAFLNAARSVVWRLHHEHTATYPGWRITWDTTLTPKERTLIKFMVDDRNVEVHESGSSRSVGQEGIAFPIGTHEVAGGMVTIGGPPGMPPAVAYKPTYSFTIDGTDQKVTEACAAYLGLLQKMVGDFGTAFP